MTDIQFDVPPNEPPAIVSQWTGGYRRLDVTCLNAVAEHYGISTLILQTYVSAEGSSPGNHRYNKSNRSIDVGPAQISSTNFPTIEKHGISPYNVYWDGCSNLAAAAYMVRLNFHRKQPKTEAEFFTAIATYHSGTPKYNRRYQKHWMEHLQAVMRRNGD